MTPLETDLLNPKEQELQTQVNSLIVSPVSQIETGDDYEAAVGFLQRLKSQERAVHALWDEDIATAHKLHGSLTSKRKRFLDAITAKYNAIDRMCGDYRERKEQERLEAERRLQEIARREQEQNLLAEAAHLERAGDVLGAECVFAEAMNAPAPVVVAPSQVPQVNGAYSRSVWKYRITNVDLIPREYMVPDDSAIGALVRAKKKLAEKLIAGIEVYDASRTVVKK